MARSDSSVNERVLDLMIHRIELLSSIGMALSTEQDQDHLQEEILRGARGLTNADGGTIYRMSGDGQYLNFALMQTDSLGIHLGGASGAFIDLPPVPLYRPDGSPNLSSVVTYAVLEEETVNIADAYRPGRFDFSATRAFDQKTGYRSHSLLAIPLRDHQHRIVGVLQLLNARAGDGATVIPFSGIAQRMAESVASQAAVAMTRQALIRDMSDLFESFVQLIADAVDRKSPYTGGHCRRVTELTLMLAEAACRSREGSLADFQMDDADRYELNIASLLHDCGKITTPEWIMDKATKLQTVYDRIGLLETRFHAVKREAEVARWRSVAAGDDPTIAEAIYEQSVVDLDHDLAFLRRVNAGTEAMADEDVRRVRAIAEKRWIGPDGEVHPLLSEEEVDNLCVRRGTLNKRERTIIEDHIVATIEMLESVPYPRHLKRVPEFAGGHHERHDGSGYPRRLTGATMSVQARIMAIADVFEALTAADRPYKQPMSLSRALHILGQMKEAGHIDPELYRVFIEAGVWKDYAEHYLRRSQIDRVDLAELPGYTPSA